VRLAVPRITKLSSCTAGGSGGCLPSGGSLASGGCVGGGGVGARSPT